MDNGLTLLGSMDVEGNEEVEGLLHKEKTQRESELALKERQCDLLATEVAAIKNCDFYETPMHGHESDPTLSYDVEVEVEELLIDIDIDI